MRPQTQRGAYSGVRTSNKPWTSVEHFSNARTMANGWDECCLCVSSRPLMQNVIAIDVDPELCNGPSGLGKL